MNPAKRPAENELKIARYKKKKEKNWVNAMLKKSKKKQKRFLNFSKHDIFSRQKCIFFAVTRAAAIAICLFDTLHCPCWNFVFFKFLKFFFIFLPFWTIFLQIYLELVPQEFCGELASQSTVWNLLLCSVLLSGSAHASVVEEVVHDQHFNAEPIGNREHK